jgi:hypothetical protein
MRAELDSSELSGVKRSRRVPQTFRRAQRPNVGSRRPDATPSPRPPRDVPACSTQAGYHSPPPRPQPTEHSAPQNTHSSQYSLAPTTPGYFWLRSYFPLSARVVGEFFEFSGKPRNSPGEYTRDAELRHSAIERNDGGMPSIGRAYSLLPHNAVLLTRGT